SSRGSSTSTSPAAAPSSPSARPTATRRGCSRRRAAAASSAGATWRGWPRSSASITPRGRPAGPARGRPPRPSRRTRGGRRRGRSPPSSTPRRRGGRASLLRPMSKISPAERPRLLFVYQEPTSFVRAALGLLRERYDVRPFAFGVRAAGGKGARAVALARGAAAQAAWLRRELPSADLVFGWFADYHLALPARAARRAGVPLAVALGGFDCMDLPQLDYGVFRTWRAPLARFVLRNASVLLPVHDSLLETHNLFLDRAQAQGVRVHVPGLATPAVEVPTGYDPAAWPLGPAERAPGVLSVGLIDSHRTFLRKGLDLLVEVARRLPAVPFEVVGLKMGE